jgi:hypothetical protein
VLLQVGPNSERSASHWIESPSDRSVLPAWIHTKGRGGQMLLQVGHKFCRDVQDICFSLPCMHSHQPQVVLSPVGCAVSKACLMLSQTATVCYILTTMRLQL